MRLFIDSNIFLSFYSFTNEDLAELDKLALLIRDGEIDLLLPKQVIDETTRNRARTINDSFKKFRETKISLQFPSYCKKYGQYASMQKCAEQLKEFHREMASDIQKDIENKELPADSLIRQLFSLAIKMDNTEQVVDRARMRIDLGNPPGKNGSLGDAMIWETLLSKVEKGDNLCIVSDDSDYSSPLDKDRLNEFLLLEWGDAKGSELYFYRSLSKFFKENSLEIDLETENEKDSFIRGLAESPNFASTHALIAKLSEYGGYTQKQVEDLIDALVANSQVHMIIGDRDVQEFYQGVYSAYSFLLTPEKRNYLKSFLRISPPPPPSPPLPPPPQGTGFEPF